MTRTLASLCLMCFALLLAACGTVATPVWEKPEATATRVAPTKTAAPPTQQPAAVVPSDTPVPLTATPVPPTAAPTSVPPTVAAPNSASPAQSNDPISFFISQSDAAHGQELFNKFNDQAGYACATCHRVDSENKLIGPGQLNLDVRAATRVPGESAERYIYNSITNPQAYIVQGFPQNLMPQVYSKIFSEQDIYDIIAYLMTLKG